MTIGSGDVARFSLVWLYNGSDEQVNVWHTGVLNPAAIYADFADDVKEYFEYLYNGLPSNMSDKLTHNRIEVFNVSDNSPEAWIGADADLNGTNGTDPLPTGVAALVYARTSVSRVIGKKYLPTFSEGTTTNGVWIGTALSNLQDLALRWGSAFEATNGTTFRSGVLHNGTTILYPIDVQVSLVPAYQRRRKVGRGA